MKQVIKVNNLSFKYNEDYILKDINITINEGEFVLLTGGSGEGKSTLIYLLSGIIPNIIYGKVEGEIFIDNENILNQRVNEICKKVGIVLQNADNQIIEKYVEDELAFGGENIGLKPDVIKQKISLISGLFNLDKKAICRKLSGGQKQKLITGSTLLMGQKIIILDEPLANLDEESSIELVRILQALTKKKYTIIVAEHRLDLIMPYVTKLFKVEEKSVREYKKDEYNKRELSNIIKPNIDKITCKTPLFSFKNVSYCVKDKTILENLNFEINKGEKVLLLGENGIGKTTLMRIIGHLNKYKGEYVSFLKDNNKILNKASKAWFKKVGVVYQNPNYQLFMKTVKEEVYFNAYSKEYAQYIISLFELENLLNRHPQSLSEGQRRKLSIAAILAMKPEVLLLDEPTVGQDFNSLKRLVEILNLIHQQTGNTMITITHDKRCAEALSERVLLLKSKNTLVEGDNSLIKTYFHY